MVPTMMRRMLDLPEDVKARYDTSSLRRVIHAGAPCPVEIKRRMIDWLGPVVWEYYSSTEGGGTSIGPEQWLQRPGSVGRPWPGADVRVLDDDGNDVKVGEIGTIYMLSNRPFSYHNAPERTEEARRGDYVTAGDLGHLDEDGFLYIADRRTDLILVGGVNVYPAEVEGVLMGHPNVADAAVIGRPDPDLGQVVHAVIAPRHGLENPETLAAELESFLEERLSAQKRPRSYAFRPELPRSEAGKLLRRILRDELQ
jgi:long-chain acyl-CoA synthetase